MSIKSGFKQLCYRWKDPKKVRIIGIYPKNQRPADTVAVNLSSNLEARQMHPLALPEAYWQKLQWEQVLCTDLISKEVKRWQLWEMKPFPVEWLLEEQENKSWEEALLEFYYQGVKGRLYLRGTYAATLFFILNLTLFVIRDGEEVLLAVQLKEHLLSSESIWPDFCSILWPKLSMQVQNPILWLKSTLSRYLKAPAPRDSFCRNSGWSSPILY